MAQAAAAFVRGVRGLGEGARTLTGATANPFDRRSVASSDGDAITGVAAPGAALGEFEVQVRQRAAGQMNEGVALNPRAAAGVATGMNLVAIDVDGQSRQVTFVVEPNSTNGDVLQAFAATLNDAQAGVAAEVVGTNAGGQRLRITGEGTGENATFAIGDVQGNAVLATRADRAALAARNAVFSINGEGFQAETNRIELDGGEVTLELDRVTNGPVTVRVRADIEVLKGVIAAFADEFNEFRRFLNANAAFLNGAITQTLDPAAQQAGAELARAGITRAADGTLQISSEQLGRALAEDPERVRSALSGPDGVATGAQLLAERASARPPLEFTAGSIASRLLATGAPILKPRRCARGGTGGQVFHTWPFI